jgi:predicted Zn-dependent peptidase
MGAHAAKEYGAAHFLQHLAFKATTKRSALKMLR